MTEAAEASVTTGIASSGCRVVDWSISRLDEGRGYDKLPGKRIGCTDHQMKASCRSISWQKPGDPGVDFPHQAMYDALVHFVLTIVHFNIGHFMEASFSFPDQWYPSMYNTWLVNDRW